MTITDRLFGGLLLAAGLSIFLYYSAWVFVTPFLAATDPLQALFPDRRYALLIPAVLLVSVFTVAGTFIGYIMLTSGKKKA